MTSQFENDYELFQCFEKDFGKNNFKIGKKGDIICNKQQKLHSWKTYFEKIDKKKEKERLNLVIDKNSYYLAEGLRTRNKSSFATTQSKRSKLDRMSIATGMMPITE